MTLPPSATAPFLCFSYTETAHKGCLNSLSAILPLQFSLGTYASLFQPQYPIQSAPVTWAYQQDLTNFLTQPLPRTSPYSGSGRQHFPTFLLLPLTYCSVLTCPFLFISLTPKIKSPMPQTLSCFSFLSAFGDLI